MDPQRSRPILLIEDDAEIREALIEVLGQLGHQTVGAGNGVEALSYLHANPAPCLILLDLMMPVMSGVEFRTRQLAEQALGSIPVVLLSAQTGLEQSATAMHVAGHLTKPIDLDQLVAAIETHGSRC